jgi:hypothetical protein
MNCESCKLKNSILSVTCCLMLLLSSCKIHYDMSGVVLGDAKTVSVEYFQNNAPLAKPTYCSNLTEALKDMLTSQTALNLGGRGSDLLFEGQVTGYAVAPIAISSGTDVAAMNRLTITVNVKFTNNKNEKANFEQSFSRYADYPSSSTINSVEDALIKTINDQLTQDIFNRALINW